MPRIGFKLTQWRGGGAGMSRSDKVVQELIIVEVDDG